jgi:hypothetical protein
MVQHTDLVAIEPAPDIKKSKSAKAIRQTGAAPAAHDFGAAE